MKSGKWCRIGGRQLLLPRQSHSTKSSDELTAWLIRHGEGQDGQPDPKVLTDSK